MPRDNTISLQSIPMGINRDEKYKLGLFQSIFKGSLLGAIEIGFNHPLWMIKTRLQNQAKFSLNPKVLYRGIGLNMASTIPITAIQVATTELMTNSMSGISSNTKNPSDVMLGTQFERVSSAFVGGSLSATVSTGAELIMAHMKENRGFKKTAQGIFHRYGALRLNIGFFGTMMRDGIYTIGFMGAPDIIENHLKGYLPAYPKLTSAISAPIAGVLAAVASQPFDTIKTRQQKVYQKKLSFPAVAKSMVKNRGFFSLYKGLLPRTAMIMSGITIMDKASREFDAHLKGKAVF